MHYIEPAAELDGRPEGVRKRVGTFDREVVGCAMAWIMVRPFRSPKSAGQIVYAAEPMVRSPLVDVSTASSTPLQALTAFSSVYSASKSARARWPMSRT